MTKIGIIGNGFSGILTAIQLIRQSKVELEIFIFGKGPIGRGIAYNSYSDKHILNVSAGKMSAFPDEPEHFLDWVTNHINFKDTDRKLLSSAYLSRNLYGEYLGNLWETSKETAIEKGIQIVEIHDFVNEIEFLDTEVKLVCETGNFCVHHCVLATGNQVPGNPKIQNQDFVHSHLYFQNPWSKNAVSELNQKLPVLIIGNGLTMIDTVIGLLENGFKGEIISLSPNGFNILPHRHNGLIYKELENEIKVGMSLVEIVSIVLKHIRKVRKFGVSAEPVVDALRPFTQQLWQHFSDEDKRLFMRRFRHLWGVARHRIPPHIHDKIVQLRLSGKLKVLAGRIQAISIEENVARVQFSNKIGAIEELLVGRIINCTGPETDIEKMSENLLKSCLEKGLIVQDSLKLGLQTDLTNFRLKDKFGRTNHPFYTLGSHLKGELWESTAVNELRQQAKDLAREILS